MIYFDNAATTSVRDEAISAMLRVMQDKYGNPSSMHLMGRRAASELSAARYSVATAMGAGADEVFFTSGGTESANWAVFGMAELRSHRKKHIITSAIEHDAVFNCFKRLENKGWSVTYLEPDSAGRITAECFADALSEDTAFASVMLVNNETGAINPVGEYSDAIKRRGLKTLLHTDAVQGFCKIPFTIKSLGVDLLTVSAHKFHGPKGVGGLYIRKGLNIAPQLLGGGQESGKRAGTEAMPLVAGFGEAARLGLIEMKETSERVRKLREFLTNRLAETLPEAKIIGEGDSPYVLTVSLPGYKAEILMSYLDGEGICVSKSAACKKGARSRTLENMRLSNEIIDGAIRVSFSRDNAIEEVEELIQALKRAAETIIRI